MILCYYAVDDEPVGGSMEFLDSQPLDVLGEGDSHMVSVRGVLRPSRA